MSILRDGDKYGQENNINNKKEREDIDTDFRAINHNITYSVSSRIK
jgi:hypothetical protein